MDGRLTALGPEGTALALLLLGHVLGDFVFQTDKLAKNKHQLGHLLIHVVIVIAVQIAAFIPLLTFRTAGIIVFIGGCHLIIDAVSAQFRDQEDKSTPLFVGDQVTHLIILLFAWSFIGSSAWTNALVVTALGSEASMPWSEMTAGAVYVSAFAFAHEGGNAIVRGVLPDEGPESEEENDLEAGSLIGVLERWIILLLGLAGLWQSVGLVVAAKSVARFEELKERKFAEYFLVGTLTSVLVAIVLVVLVSVLI